jgi:hypothetical protein
VNNLASDPAHADTVQQLREQLTAYLKKTKDPRFVGREVKFDTYPYRDDRIHRRIEEWREKQGAANGR